MANICANCLQVVTKDTLENQVGLGMCMARFASHCGIIRAHPKQSRFQLSLQLGAKCLVLSQLTISILGMLRRHCIPLATYRHTTTGLNSRSSNKSRHTRTGVSSSSSTNSRSNSNSNQRGPQIWVQGTSEPPPNVLLGSLEADFERLKYTVASAISRSNHNRSCGKAICP